MEMEQLSSKSAADDLAHDKLAAMSFIEKFHKSGYDLSTRFEVCALYDALYSLFLRNNKEKILLLYFHNGETEFSESFFSLLSDIDIKNNLNQHFNLLGWDVEDDEYQEILMNTLSNVLKLEPCIEMIKNKEPAVIFIAPIDMDFEICSVMRKKLDVNEFRLTLSVLIKEFCSYSNNTHDDSEELNCSMECDKDNFGYEEFQQRMCDNLGDRDYDNFDPNELEKLKDKISFALFGIPEDEGYSDKQSKEIEKMYKIVLETNNKYSEYENQVVIAIVYNCLVPLEAKDSNKTYSPVPVFILRKCRESKDPCRMLIDHTRRVYKSWQDYLDDNKFCKCLMVVPESGRYSKDDNGKVQLSNIVSPACHIGKQVLKATDITTAVLGMGSSGILIGASIIPAITLGPIAAIGAAAVGIGAGVYSVARSTATLIDRALHKESLNVTEAESRGAYLNIAAGTVGFAGCGANAVVSQLASNGVNIGTTARIAVNTIGVANIGIGGLAVSNSAVEIFMRWYIDDEAPSSLSVLQLSTSILFFGHAIYSFKTAGTIIEENQTSMLQDLKDMLTSNKQRKMFRKLELETLRINNGNIQRGNAEVIATILRMKNKNDIFSFFSRTNKHFNKLGIKFAAKDGQVVFNGLQVDLGEVCAMSRSDTFSFFLDLSKSHNDSSVSRGRISAPTKPSSLKFNFTALNTLGNAHKLVNLLVSPLTLKKKLCSIVSEAITFFAELVELKILECLRILFPDSNYIYFTKMVLSFIQRCVNMLLEKKEKGELGDCFNFLLKYVSDLNNDDRKLAFSQHVCNVLLKAFRSGKPSDITKSLIKYSNEWILNAFMDKKEAEDRQNCIESSRRKAKKVICKTCSGHCFE